MTTNLKTIETAVNMLVSKPIVWLVYGLLLAVAYGLSGLVGCGRLVRRRYALIGEKS
jgi:hypothetical protein